MQSVADRLRALLEAAGRHWPAPIDHLVSIGSTNDRLKERARSGASEWTVVLADRQTAGRGRHGHSWVSPPGNLYSSVLLRPAFGADRVCLLPLAAGVAVAEALAACGVEAQLKWPNDVLVGGRKIAGILAEGLAGASGVDVVVLGIGVNVNAAPAGLPPEIRATAASLEGVTNRAWDPVSVAAAVLPRLSVWYDALGRGDPRSIVAAWRDRSVPWWGRIVEVRSGAEVIRGVARDVDANGGLRLELEDGHVTTVVSGEVQELRLT